MLNFKFANLNYSNLLFCKIELQGEYELKTSLAAIRDLDVATMKSNSISDD